MLPDDTIRALVSLALAEDLGGQISLNGDITSHAIFTGSDKMRAVIRARQPLCLAGMNLAAASFQQMAEIAQAPSPFRAVLKDGAWVGAGEVVAELEGATRGILAAERVALNFLTHLSGIATLTRHYVEAVAGTNAQIRDTRKTLAGLRVLEKYAVRCGGGINHRMGLYDALLIKDNHIAAANGVALAIRRARAAAPNMKLEVEIDDLAQLQEALAENPDAILLDNMTPTQVSAALAMAESYAKEQASKSMQKHSANGVKLEVSGGVTLASVRAYAQTGVAYIAVGALTHSAPAVDLGLDHME